MPTDPDISLSATSLDVDTRVVRNILILVGQDAPGTSGAESGEGETMETSAATVSASQEKRCVRCHTLLGATQDREVTANGLFCRSCHNNLQSERARAIEDQSRDINYPMALLGALVGGTIGVLAWWGITVMSNTAFGVVAILIGIAVGKGATWMAGNKTSRGVQVMSVVIAGVSFFYASYLVNRTFVQQALAKDGKEVLLSLFPNPDLFLRVVLLDFDFLTGLFLAIALYEAWKFSAPLKA